ncbi:AvrD family protein [Actinosynnema sp. NPDC023658]|uniref:AvrD family protein n=1 Tax=Actinosynnema sp. NPDC023658 TaxID=3155465 RepID=UPI0033F2D65B
MTTTVTVASIDDALGPGAQRFFGSGYKRVSQSLADLRPTAGGLTAAASIRYPPDWSRKSRDAELVPHLSTIDALVLGVRLVETHLVHTFRLTARQRTRMWLRRCTMKSGAAPQEQLADFTVEVRLVETRRDPDALCGNVSRFDCRIGRIKVPYEVEHPGAEPFPAGGDIGAEASTGSRYWVDGYKERVHHIGNLLVDVEARRAEAGVAVVPAARADVDLAAAYDPALTMVDCTVVMAQLAQALLYRVDGIERGRSNTLWMRRIDMAAPTPYQPLANPFTISTTVVRDRLLSLAGGTWRASDFVGDCQGFHVAYSLAHQLPTTQGEQQ